MKKLVGIMVFASVFAATMNMDATLRTGKQIEAARAKARKATLQQKKDAKAKLEQEKNSINWSSYVPGFITKYFSSGKACEAAKDYVQSAGLGFLTLSIGMVGASLAQVEAEGGIADFNIFALYALYRILSSMNVKQLLCKLLDPTAESIAGLPAKFLTYLSYMPGYETLAGIFVGNILEDALDAIQGKLSPENLNELRQMLRSNNQTAALQALNDALAAKKAAVK